MATLLPLSENRGARDLSGDEGKLVASIGAPGPLPAWAGVAEAAAAVLAEAPDEEQALSGVAELLLQLLDAEGCVVWRMRPQVLALSPLFGFGDPCYLVAGERPVDSLVGRVAATGEPLTSENAADAGDGVYSSLCLPVRLPDGEQGTLEVVNKRSGPGFGPADLELAAAVAPALTLALAQRRRSESHRRELHELQTLVSVAERLNRESDPERALGDLVKMAQEIVGAEAGFGLLLDALRENLRVAAAVGRGAPALGGAMVAVEGSLEGAVARSGELAAARDLDTHPDPRGGLRLHLDFPVTSVLCVPLRSGDDVFGVIELANSPRTAGFGADEARLLTALAAQAAPAIGHATRLERLKRAFILTLECLGVAFDNPGADSQNHPQRTIPVAKAISEGLGLSALENEIVVLTALLHDIGKMAIDPQLLQESRQLTEGERAVVRAHPLMAAMFLQPLVDSHLRELVESLEHHHEWVDGRGYPDALRGDQIPMASRILAVVHAYCAMTEGRPYQAPKSPAEAVEELRRWAGSQFDARVVEALVAAVCGGAQG